MRKYERWQREPFRRFKPVMCWGQMFPSIKALATDPRCMCSYAALYDRICYQRMSPEAAASRTAHAFYPILWGRRGLREISQDPRCVCSLKRLTKRVRAGWPVELAATTPNPTIRETAELFGCSQGLVAKAKKSGVDLDYFEPIYLLWGYTNFSQIAKDSRCVVSAALLRQRVRAGWDIEKAATTETKNV